MELRDVFGVDAACAGGGDVDPGVAVALGDGEGVGEDLCGLEGVVRGEGGDLFAAAGAGLEAPAVVFALDGVAIEPTGGEWDAAVRAEVAQREERAVAFAAEEQRDVEESGGDGLAECVGAERGVPVVVDEVGGRPGRAAASSWMSEGSRLAAMGRIEGIGVSVTGRS